jgi:group II intron reverse transcriptase/maturase
MQTNEMKARELKYKMNSKTLSTSSKDLFEQLCTEAKLLEGWRDVKRNRGTSGIDGQTIEDFKIKLHEEIIQLKEELQNWQYNPQPVRRVEIPKPGSKNEKRNLGIPSVRDRIVQAAIKQLLEPILDLLFSSSSYGFRPGKNQRQAVEAAQGIVQTGKDYVVDIDLSKFFDRINQDRLIDRLSKIIEDKRILKLIGMMLRSGVMQDGLIMPTKEGAIQGSPLSPLLSNLVLDELDKEIEKRGLEHCRFADDCNIFVKTPKAAERVMASISKFIEKKLKLVVNKDKSKVAKGSAVKFLGMTIIDKTRAIAKKSLSNALKKVKELTPRGTHEKLEATIKRINEWYIGWSSYYSMTQYPSQLAGVEAHIRRRLRSRIVDQQKSRRHLFNKLMKRGIGRYKAAKVCFSNMKRWKLSHTKVVERAYSNRWFIDDMNLKIRSIEKRKDWFDIKKWICLI